MNELKSYGRTSGAMDGMSDEAGVRDGEVASLDGFASSSLSSVPVDRYSAQIARAIESDIIPRLMMAYRSAPTPITRTGAARTVMGADVEALAQSVMAPSPAAGRSEVNRHLDTGLPMDRLFLDLLAPAAKRLGELWTDDQCDFAAVTIGLCRLQDILRDLAQDPMERIDPSPTGRILLAITPGEQHTFGVLMLEELFRRSGYDVTAIFPASANILLREIRINAYDVVGLSASCDKSLHRLPDLVRALRRESRNSDLTVMVGGPIFADQPERAREVGADLYAVDGASALLQIGKRLGVGLERVKAF